MCAVHRLLGVLSKALGRESTSIDAIPMFGVLLQLAELRGHPFALTLVTVCFGMPLPRRVAHEPLRAFMPCPGMQFASGN